MHRISIIEPTCCTDSEISNGQEFGSPALATPPPQSTRRTVHFHDSPGEDFDFSDLPPEHDTPTTSSHVPHTTMLRTPPRTHSTPVTPHRSGIRPATPASVRRASINRASTVPRSAFYGRTERRARKAGGKSRRAEDVRTFFEEKNGRVACHFCLYVFLLNSGTVHSHVYQEAC